MSVELAARDRPVRHGHRSSLSGSSTRRSTGFRRRFARPLVLCCLDELSYEQAATQARLERTHAPGQAPSWEAAAGAAASRLGDSRSLRSSPCGARAESSLS